MLGFVAFVYMDFGVVLDPLLVVEHEEALDEGGQDGLRGVPDQIGVVLPEGGRGLLQVVVGYLGEQVVDLMRSNVMHQSVSPSIMPVNRAKLTSNKVPLVIRIPWYTLLL